MSGGNKIIEKVVELAKSELKNAVGNDEILKILEEIKSNKEFLNKIDIEIQNQNQSNMQINFEENKKNRNTKDECLAKLSNSKKETQKNYENDYIIKFKIKEEVFEGNGKKFYNKTEEIKAPSKKEAKKILMSQNKDNELKNIKILSKDEVPRFTKKEVIKWWKWWERNFKENDEYNYSLSECVNDFFNLEDWIYLDSKSAYDNFLKRYNIKYNEKNKEYLLNETEKNILDKLMEESNE